MKKLTALSTLFALATSAFAAEYLYIGNSTASMADPANYLLITEGSLSGLPFEANIAEEGVVTPDGVKITGRYVAATEAPTDADTIISVNAKDYLADGTTKSRYATTITTLATSDSFAAGNYYRRNNSSHQFTLGSKDAMETDFVWWSANDLKFRYGSSCVISAANDAAQSSFVISTGKTFSVTLNNNASNTIKIGTKEKFIDLIEAGENVEFYNAVPTLYVKNIKATKNIMLSADTTFFIDKSALIEADASDTLSTALITADGTFELKNSPSGNTIFTFDFSSVDIDDDIYGNTYNLISATSYTGVNIENMKLAGLDDKIIASLAWDESGKNIQVSFAAVPEPATVATIFGAVALALTMYRRRK